MRLLTVLATASAALLVSLFGLAPAQAQKVSNEIKFDNQGTPILIPEWQDATFCALTHLAISNSQGTIGACRVWKNDQGKWMMQATSNPGWQNCSVVCWKSEGP
jgi:hypothetical protein